MRLRSVSWRCWHGERLLRSFQTAPDIIECFSGRHRGGRMSASFLRLSRPFFNLFHLETCTSMKGTPEAPLDYTQTHNSFKRRSKLAKYPPPRDTAKSGKPTIWLFFGPCCLPRLWLSSLTDLQKYGLQLVIFSWVSWVGGKGVAVVV